MYLNFKTGNPKKDGNYYFIRNFGKYLDITTMSFTVQYGWNTTAENHEHPVKEGEYYVGYAPTRRVVSRPKNSEIINDMLEDLKLYRIGDPLSNNDYYKDSEEMDMWENLAELQDTMEDAKERYELAEYYGCLIY